MNENDLHDYIRKADEYTQEQLSLWKINIGDPMRKPVYLAVFNTRLAAMIEANSTTTATAPYALKLHALKSEPEPERPTRDELMDIVSGILEDIYNGPSGANAMSNHNRQKLQAAMDRWAKELYVPSGMEIDTHDATAWALSWTTLMWYFLSDDRRWMPGRFENDPELLRYVMYQLWLPADPQRRDEVVSTIGKVTLWQDHVYQALQIFDPNLNWSV